MQKANATLEEAISSALLGQIVTSKMEGQKHKERKHHKRHRHQSGNATASSVHNSANVQLSKVEGKNESKVVVTTTPPT